MFRIVCRLRVTAFTIPRKSPLTNVTPDDSMAMSVPVPMAMPTSAAARAGASLMPSPAIATLRPLAFSALIRSPEQALSAVPDERSDIYSLGAVAYYLTTGRSPFVHDNAIRVILAHARDVPTQPSQLNSDVPSELAQVIMKCLEKKPEDRFANVRLLHQALIDCESDDVWSPEKAALWWKHHGCPHKKKLDAEVLQLSMA